MHRVRFFDPYSVSSVAKLISFFIFHIQRQKLYDCCLALKPPYREVALDYYYHEMEISEIVAKTGKNIKTLQTQIYRAKGMLKKLYGKEEPAYGKTAHRS